MSSEAFRDLGGGLCITEVNPEDFASIDFRGKSLTPTSSKEQTQRPKEASFMDRILRGGSGALLSESMVSNLIHHLEACCLAKGENTDCLSPVQRVM